jgi:hypothetical protein
LTGFFFSFFITDKSAGASNPAGSPAVGQLSVPVSHAEFEIIKTVSQFMIPRFLGFDLYSPTEISSSSTGGGSFNE